MKKKLNFVVMLSVMFGVTAAFAQDPSTDSMKDSRDGQVYEVVKIGDQWWMAENLRFDAGNGSWCYDNDPGLCEKYGRLYDWETANNACPSGWHLPGDEDWKNLERSLGVAGLSIDQMGWRDFETDLLYDEVTGMRVIMGGYRPYGDGAFDDGGDDAYFWTSSEKEKDDAWKRYLDDNRMQIGRGYDDKREGFSVRCIKD